MLRLQGTLGKPTLSRNEQAEEFLSVCVVRYSKSVKLKYTFGLTYVVVFAMFTVVLAQKSQNVGLLSYIAFVISLGFQSLFIVVRLWRSLLTSPRKNLWWMLLASLLTPAFLFFTLMLASFTAQHVMSELGESLDGQALTIIVYVMGYTLPQLHLLRSKIGGAQTYSISAVVIFYSLLLCLFAGVAFVDPQYIEQQYRAVLLVLAIQLQFVMNYITINTPYFQRIYPLAQKTLSFTRWKDEESASNLAVAFGALPFLLPFIVIAVATLID